MKFKLLLLFSILTFSSANAQVNYQAAEGTSNQKVIFLNDNPAAQIESILKAAGIEVSETQPTFLKIFLGKELKITTYIDIDGDKQYLLFNGSNALKEGTTPVQAKDLVSDMNSQTNFIKAAYNQEKNKVDFTYFFWIKDGFTGNSLLSALEMYRITYMYTFSLDKNDLLK